MDVRVFASGMAKYNRWVNEQIYAAAETIGEAARRRELGGPFGSLHGTLEHLVMADTAWMQRFAGEPLTAFDMKPALATFDALRAARDVADDRIDRWAAALEESFVVQPYTFFSRAYRREITMPGWVAVTHVFNHQTHHRGQVVTLLRQAGYTGRLSADLAFMPTEPTPSTPRAADPA